MLQLVKRSEIILGKTCGRGNPDQQRGWPTDLQESVKRVNNYCEHNKEVSYDNSMQNTKENQKIKEKLYFHEFESDQYKFRYHRVIYLSIDSVKEEEAEIV